MLRQPLTHRSKSLLALSKLMTLALLLASLVTTTAHAQAEEDDSGKPAKLFSSGASMDITITAPWSEIQKQKKNQNPYPAKLNYVDEAGQPVALDLTVGRRGIKRQEVCPFPPIRLTFVKEAVANTTFRGNDELKLVTHCNKNAKFDQYYVLEMLAYHMYNLLTDYSYRVKPLQITYIDSKNGKPVDTRFGFLIESNGDMAKRNGLRKLDIPKINHKRLEAKSTALLTLFQYMIANPDWAASIGHDPAKCCHNVKLIGPEPFLDTDFAIPVAYDFDSAGLVDPEYAAPPEGLPIKSVTQRLYRGYCAHNDQLEAARLKTLEQEGAIMALIQNESRLNEKNKNKTLKFMAKYFEIAKDPGQFQKNVVAECRGTK